VTDFARFAYLSDVFIAPEHRGQGLGRWLVETMLVHPELDGVRWALHTGDAHGLYRQLGFEAADETVMQRPRPPLR
jgi:GNAT superfamily N-acetyltransferase